MMEKKVEQKHKKVKEKVIDKNINILKEMETVKNETSDVKHRNRIYPKLPVDNEKENEKNTEDNIYFNNDVNGIENDNIPSKFGSCLNLFFLAVCLISVIIISFFLWTRDNQVVVPKIQTYNELLNDVKKDFSMQTDFSWKIVNVTIREHIFNKTPSKPAVMNLLGDRNQVDKLIHSLSTIFTRMDHAAECALMPGFKVPRDNDDMKIAVERAVTEARHHRSRCIHMPHLDHVPASLGPFLHGLTDEISAKHKDFLFIFSVTKDDVRSISDYEAETRLETVLEDAWMEDMGEERFRALMSRLAVNVVVVR